MTKAALITGAAGGLGLTLTRLLADEGWLVFAADCNPSALNALAGETGVVAVPIDVTDTESVEAAYSQVAARVERLDAVVNFAGILRVGAMVEIDEEVLRQLLDVNLMGTYRVNKTFFPLLQQGRIVNISSETGWHTTSPFNGPYAMSKYGIEAYSDALRRELSLYKIPVIAVQPGPFRTNLVAEAADDFARAASSSKLFQTQLQHFGKLVANANTSASEPEYLARVIYKALVARRPRHRYSVKADARRSLLEYLPMRWADAIFHNLLARKQLAPER